MEQFDGYARNAGVRVEDRPKMWDLWTQSIVTGMRNQRTGEGKIGIRLGGTGSDQERRKESSWANIMVSSI